MERVQRGASRGTGWCFAVAAAVHAAAISAAWLTAAPRAIGARPSHGISLLLALPPETENDPLLTMAAAAPATAAPGDQQSAEGNPPAAEEQPPPSGAVAQQPLPLPEPTATPAPESAVGAVAAPTAEEESELAREKARLRAEISGTEGAVEARLRAAVARTPTPTPVVPEPQAAGAGTSGGSSAAGRAGGGGGAAPTQRATLGEGTVRGLDLSGWPDDVQVRVMARWGLQVRVQALAGAVGDSYLSTAATGAESFESDNQTAPGLYQVFVLSRKAIMRLSVLEQEEIARRGLDLNRVRIKRVQFGIGRIEGGGPEPDLIVKSMQTERVP